MTDESLRKAVEKELDWEPAIDAAHIGVAAKDGAVTLTGTVSSYSERTHALEAAERVYGVRAVADELEVEIGGESVRDDADIAEAASCVLQWDAHVPKTVRAEVRDGRLTLKGRVDSQFQRDEAEKILRRLIGVREVFNEVTVEPHVRPTGVAQRIEDALARQGRLDAGQITVTAHDGTVRLEGQVRSLAEKRAAHAAATAAPGVVTVDDQTVVVP
jgi:osmotically-inducible protein OsmY